MNQLPIKIKSDSVRLSREERLFIKITNDILKNLYELFFKRIDFIYLCNNYNLGFLFLRPFLAWLLKQ